MNDTPDFMIIKEYHVKELSAEFLKGIRQKLLTNYDV